MNKYLVKKIDCEGITFNELTDLIKCIRNEITITIDYSNVIQNNKVLKPQQYIATLNKYDQVKLVKERHRYNDLDSLYKHGLVNAYLKDINFKIKVVGKEQQLKIV